ncbi:MAG: alpha/beta hydrolase, partial [Armatimonadota bacterium]
KLQERVFEILKREPNNDTASDQIYQILLENLPNRGTLNDAQKTAIREQAKAYTSPWFRTFVTLDPAPYLRQVRCPVLVLNGERDLQVDPEQNLPAIERALKEGGNRHFTIRRLPNLNHLFQKAATGLPTEYTQIEETFNESALQVIADWLDQTVRKQVRR